MISLNNLVERSRYLEGEIRNRKEELTRIDKSVKLISRRKDDDKYSYAKKIKCDDGKFREIYLGTDSSPEIEQLAYDGLLPNIIKDLVTEKRAVDNVIAMIQRGKSADEYLMMHPGIAKVLLSRDMSGSFNPLTSDDARRRAVALQWKNESYQHFEGYSKYLKIATIVPGLNVRSKSESLLVSEFEKYYLPYHYEELFIVPDSFYAYYGPNTSWPNPDFRLLNVRTGRIIWWEHQGLWDDLGYVKRQDHKNEMYYRAGLVPWQNLIITTETADMPLDVAWVEKIIEHYLL